MGCGVHTYYLSPWEVEAVGEQEFGASLCLSETLSQNTKEKERNVPRRKKLGTRGPAVLFQRAAGAPSVGCVCAEFCLWITVENEGHGL